MPGHWTRLECELIVADYLDMLAAECRLERYNKAEHRRRLATKLNDRSEGSIEFKHQNISAVLIRAGHIYIRGYKPAWNYQELLEEVVLERVSVVDREISEIETKLIEQEAQPVEGQSFSDVVVDPPERVPQNSVRDKPQRVPRRVNYAEREQRNRKLGERGEEFVLEYERNRLRNAGRDDLVGDVEWTSKERGDGTGYDIRSFRDDTDEPRFIEVKTTNAGKYQPFMMSRNEVSFSEEFADQYSLYRVFEFARSPAMFILSGAVADYVDLKPTVFLAEF